MQVTPIDNNLFDVTSERDPERSYVVEAGKSCTCAAFQFRGGSCKHLRLVDETIASQPLETDLQRALRKAQRLSDAELSLWARKYESGAIAGACRLELARRVLAARERDPQHAAALENAQVIDAAEWMRQDAIEAGCPAAPRPIPAGVMVLLEGATEAERERALEIYK